jgi:hypothetical protein
MRDEISRLDQKLTGHLQFHSAARLQAADK